MIQTLFASLRRKRRAPVRTQIPGTTFTAEEAVETLEAKDPREQLPDIARASVQLAELGPRLAAFAAELESQARACVGDRRDHDRIDAQS